MDNLKICHIDISIIVTLYHGQKYVVDIIDQVKENVKNLSGLCIELILYNDDPSEYISYDYENDSLNLLISIINSHTNLGIHGARVNGLKASSGDIVMFLDQDDIISPNYLLSQLDSLGDGDVVVCKCIHNNKIHYTDSYRLSEVVTADFMMNRWNSIVTPGQVIMRRRAIPDIWVERILTINGSDDYYLWLLFCGLGIEFKHNDTVLFEHTMSGENTSLDTNKMMDSEDEMISILLDCDIFDDNQKHALKNLRRSLRRIHVKELEDYREAFYCYSLFTGVIGDELKETIVGIYGAGIIGKTVRKILRDNYGISTVLIDRNADYFNEDGMIKPDAIPDNIGIIVVTPLPRRTLIVEELKGKCSGRVYSIGEFVDKYFKNNKM